MRYKWGFIESGVFTECHPVVEDGMSLDYSKEQGEQFYRAKLSSSIDFHLEDYDTILSKGYNYEHIVALLDYETDDEVWRGKFTLTDCEVNVDKRLISVQPETIDNYTKVLAHVQDEYNMIKLQPKMQPINIKIRPCLQLYALNDSKLTNYIGESYWEADCEQIGNRTDMLNTYHFAKIAETFTFFVDFDYTIDGQTVRLEVLASGNPATWEYETWNGNQVRIFYASANYIYVHGSQAIPTPMLFPVQYVIFNNGDLRFGVHPPTDQFAYQSNTLFMADIADSDIGLPMTIYVAHAHDGNAQLNYIYARCILQTELAQITLGSETLDTYDLPSNDIAGAVNLNYNKVTPITTALVKFTSSTRAQETPTQWGQSYYNDAYFTRYTESGYNPLPVGITEWKYASLWVTPYYLYRNYIDAYSANRTIKDCYPLASVIKQLFAKADNSIAFQLDNQQYSQFFFASDFPIVANAFRLYVTPRSNIISSYYDSPAQKAPITLANILEMLKNAFKVYWYIDSNKILHFEHLNYFENGLSYDEANTVLLDLDTLRHTRTLNSKDYGQNTYKYDKQDMHDQFQYEWDDTQTLPFTGLPMKAVDTYVSQGSKDDLTLSKFDADIDYILSTPDGINKDGFALMACRYEAGEPTFATSVESGILIKDEDGVTVNYNVQNADCAIAKRQQDMLRYGLPCENWLISNMAETAKTTGNYKLQTLEFADLTMRSILWDISNCIKTIRTQQGDGHIKTLSINLNSFSAKADLLFNFIGRKYYLKGTALSGTLTIYVNGEAVTIEVSNNGFTYGYTEPLQALNFADSNVVSVDFADSDNLDNLTSADNMFRNCAELVSVDFSNKTFGAVASASNMFAGATQLQILTCPSTNSWKPDLDFSDCEYLSVDSLDNLIVNFLYPYESGTHTITPNMTMWQALDSAVQDDIIAKANAKGWNIAIPAQYSITGQSAASTVYATINGAAVEIPVTAGAWHYDYNTAITSFSFEADADVTDIDFSLSDGLAGVTSLNDAFKDCSGLTSVDFTNCDLSNVASAADTFANCSALYELIIPQDTWKPDIDLSASVMPKTEMLNVINGLYIYTSGTHTITFNSTIWDAMSVADQQIVFDAAQLKWWTTNAVAVVYKIKGTSTAASETFTLDFIDDDTQQVTTETITCAVDGNGKWEHQYNGKKIYRMISTFMNNTTITSVEFNEPMGEVISMGIYPNGCFLGCSNLASVTFANNSTFAKLTSFDCTFSDCVALASIDLSMSLFPQLTIVRRMFMGCTNLTSVSFDNANAFNTLTNMNNWFTDCVSLTSVAFLSNAQFANVTTATTFLNNCDGLITIDLHSATFASLTTMQDLFSQSTNLVSVDLSSVTFANVTSINRMFYQCTSLTTITWSNALDFGSLTDARQCFQECASLTNASVAAFANQTFANVVYFSNCFNSCTSLTSVDLHSATFASLINGNSIFSGCTNLTSIDLSGTTFANVQLCNNVFRECKKLTTIVGADNFTFASATETGNMFYYCEALTSLDLHSATFASATTTSSIFQRCSNLVTLNINLANWSNVTTASSFIRNCPKLTTIVLSVSNAFTKTNSTSGCNITESPLTYQSMLNIANWMPTTTTSRSVTYKASAWNALSTAEQTNIDTILSGKNWTRAIA